MEGVVENAVPGLHRAAVSEAEPPLRARTRRNGWTSFFAGLGLIAAGALVGLAVSLVLFWDRVVHMKISF
jgi:hypothetical protein